MPPTWSSVAATRSTPSSAWRPCSGANGGDGSDGFVLRGIDAYDKCGFAVSGAGDLNHDGYDDVVVGAPFAEPGASVAAGETYVVFGRGTPFPAEVPLPGLFPANGGDGSAGFVLTGEGNSYQGGYAVSNAGDLNADGFDDLAVSAPGAKVGDRFDAGRIFIVYGRATGFPAAIELATLAADPSAGFAINGRSTDDLAGNAVSNAGDVNADGVDDLVIGANHASNEYGYEAGEAYVVFGRRAACTPADIAAPYATLNLDDIAAFASAFVAADPLADLDANGVLDLDDITAFAQAFVAGCP
ncbi:MAG: integrin alpha [Phycisphaerales bacterium]